MKYQFEFSYKCKCNTKTHFLYPSKQNNEVTPNMSNFICPTCNTKISIKKIIKTNIDKDKIVSTAVV